MKQKERNFYSRSQPERLLLEENTWCDTCHKADLGLVEPREYEEAGEIFIEGKCRKCGSRVVCQIVEKEIE
jgi:hypothetical protein